MKMISDIRFVDVCGKKVMQVKRSHVQVDASGAFCGLIDMPWEAVMTVHFGSVDEYRQHERDDRANSA
jgi:hypothetical protein